MKRNVLPALFMIALGVFADAAHADDEELEEVVDEEDDEDDNDYAEAGTIEVGGSLGLSWLSQELLINATPSIGYFIWDNFELSGLVNFAYRDVPTDDGDRDGTFSGAVVVEPSYHHAIQGDDLFLLLGLGVGAGYHGDSFDFETIPRLGLNVVVGDVIITPAVRVPLVINPDETTAGVVAEVGLSTTL